MTGPRVGMMFLLYFIVIAILVWISVRLAPASAYSVKSRAFRPLGSWKAMRGFVWRGIGSVLILSVLGAIILSVVYFILLSILLFSSGIFQAGLKIWHSPDGLAEFYLALIENLTSASSGRCGGILQNWMDVGSRQQMSWLTRFGEPNIGKIRQANITPYLV